MIGERPGSYAGDIEKSLHLLHRNPVWVAILPTSRLWVTYTRHFFSRIMFADRDAAPSRIDYLGIARKTPCRENTSFVTPFSALPLEGITPCCSIICRAHHATRASGNAGGYHRAVPARYPFLPAKVPGNTTVARQSSRPLRANATVLPHGWAKVVEG